LDAFSEARLGERVAQFHHPLLWVQTRPHQLQQPLSRAAPPFLPWIFENTAERLFRGSQRGVAALHGTLPNQRAGR
jgi:hypothetical protein